jgi:hypothetical protein
LGRVIERGGVVPDLGGFDHAHAGDIDVALEELRG